MTLGASPEPLRQEIRNYLLMPPSLEDLQGMQNGLLMEGRLKSPSFTLPKTPATLETCANGLIEFLVTRPAGKRALSDLATFRRAESHYKDRELRTTLNALLLLKDPAEEVVRVMADIHRTTLEVAVVEMYQALFFGELEFWDWKPYIQALHRRHPQEALIYKACLEPKHPRDFIIHLLGGNVEAADTSKLLKNAINFSFMKFFESQVISDGLPGMDTGADWLGRAYSGVDRQLKWRLVDVQTKEPTPTDPIELETDEAGSGIANVEDLDEEIDIQGPDEEKS
jgi:hypothetical protein